MMAHVPTSVAGGERYRQRPSIAWREIDGEAVLVDAGQGRLLVLNEVGLFLWNLLARDVTLEELSKEMVVTFEVDRSLARRNVETFLSELHDRDLIECP